MATIRARKVKGGKVSYTVQIRVKGRPSASRTFDRKTDAREWAEATERAIRRGWPVGRRTVGQAIESYRAHALGTLVPALQVGRERHLSWWEKRIGAVALSELGPGHVREHLRTLVGRRVATLNRYRAALSAVLSFVVEEEWIERNPLHGARRRHRPKSDREEERDREISPAEMARLREACLLCTDRRLFILLICAHASGARQAELVGMEWKRLDLAATVPRCEILDTKNGTSRVIFFPGEAGDLLRLRRQAPALSRFVFAEPGDRPDRAPVFPVAAWRYWRRKAGLADVRFHDLRHTWACEMIDMGRATLAELMILGGWKTAAMVRRYASRAQRHGSAPVEARHALMPRDSI